MKNVPFLILALVVFVVLPLLFFQWYGKRAARECMMFTEMMGSDGSQCFTGNPDGFLAINLHVEPIAYRIALHRRRLMAEMLRWDTHRRTEEIAGVETGKAFHEVIQDEDLARIVEQVAGYTRQDPGRQEASLKRMIRSMEGAPEDLPDFGDESGAGSKGP